MKFPFSRSLFFILCLALSSMSHSLFAEAPSQKSDCKKLMSSFFKAQSVSQLSLKWNAKEKSFFDEEIAKLFNSNQQQVIRESLELQKELISSKRALSYLYFAHGLNPKNEKQALLDLSVLDQRAEKLPANIEKFLELQKKIQAKLQKNNLSGKAARRYEDLFMACRSLKPNELNSNAGKDFMRFNLALNLGTLGTSYALFNMDEEKNLKWYGELGYDVVLTVIFSHFSGLIQTKATDSQMSKALKNYFLGRALGSADIFIYGPVFENEHEKAKARVEQLRKDPDYRQKIDELLASLNDQNTLQKFKTRLISAIKDSQIDLSFGVQKNKGVDEFGVDWNHLTPDDLDKPHVQEVLVLAALTQIYHESQGSVLATGDSGVDRYTYHSLFYALSIPKNLVQNYVTYQILCMEQDKPKIAFTKALLLNVGANFLSNQVLYDQREKAINQ